MTPGGLAKALKASGEGAMVDTVTLDAASWNNSHFENVGGLDNIVRIVGSRLSHSHKDDIVDGIDGKDAAGLVGPVHL